MAQQPFKGIDSLYLFPYYQTPEQYAVATGMNPPPFDPSKPPKYWFDPVPENSSANKTVMGRVILYSQALAMSGNHPAQNAVGKPFLEPLVLDKTIAAEVNIPTPGSLEALPQVPPPLRALLPGEELVFQFAGVAAVHDTSIPLPGGGDTGFNEKDRATLQAIARALGI